MEDTVVTKRRTRAKAAPEAASAAETPPPAAAPRLDQPAPRRARINLVERALDAVQFHTGVQLGTVTKTGVNVAHFKNSLSLEVELRLVGPGVWIKLQGQEFVVPFSNVLSTKLSHEDAA